MYDIAAVQDPTHADAFKAEASRNETDGAEIERKAQGFEREAEVRVEAGEHHERRHHRLTLGATLVHIAIAVATISIITGGQRWPWYASLVLGLAGTAAAGTAYLL